MWGLYQHLEISLASEYKSLVGYFLFVFQVNQFLLLMFILYCKINALYCCKEMFNTSFFKHDTRMQVYMVTTADKIDLIYKNKAWIFEKPL